MLKEIVLFLYRVFCQILMFISIELPLQLIGAAVLLLYLPVHRALYKAEIIKDMKLPYLLRWFDNADMYIGRDTTTYAKVFASNLWTHYCWLAWRNPINYFEYLYLGYQFRDRSSYVVYGALNVGTDGIPGYKIIEVNGEAYQYTYVHKWSQTACFYFTMGAKIADESNKPNSYAEHCFTISPYRSYTGK